MASKNLPAAIEDTSGSELPESIREKAEAVQEAGGISSVEKMFYNLPGLLQTNREILDEVGTECGCEGGGCEEEGVREEGVRRRVLVYIP